MSLISLTNIKSLSINVLNSELYGMKMWKYVFFGTGKWRIMSIPGMWASMTEAKVWFYQEWKVLVFSWSEVSNSSPSDTSLWAGCFPSTEYYLIYFSVLLHMLGGGGWHSTLERLSCLLPCKHGLRLGIFRPGAWNC